MLNFKLKVSAVIPMWLTNLYNQVKVGRCVQLLVEISFSTKQLLIRFGLVYVQIDFDSWVKTDNLFL